jgi:hypothetical protein
LIGVGNPVTRTESPSRRRIVTFSRSLRFRLYSDCFKYGNKIGLDVALEALRAFRRPSDFKLDELWKYAALQRVARVMKPYLEAIA